MKIDFGRLLTKLSFCSLLLAGYVAPANAQFKLQQDFTGTTATGWTLSNSAILTAPSIDTAGSGWLRLTDTGNTEKGAAVNGAFSFAGNVPVVVEFNPSATEMGKFDLPDGVFVDTTMLSTSQFYVNSHSAANPTGEVRGQIVLP